VQELIENNLQTASEVRTPKPEEEQITTAVGAAHGETNRLR
jgi:hypothetical protein